MAKSDISYNAKCLWDGSWEHMSDEAKMSSVQISQRQLSAVCAETLQAMNLRTVDKLSRAECLKVLMSEYTAGGKTPFFWSWRGNNNKRRRMLMRQTEVFDERLGSRDNAEIVKWKMLGCVQTELNF